METKPIRVLLIEDNPDDVFFLKRVLQKVRSPAFDLEVMDNLAGGLDRVSAGNVDVILLDLALSDSAGFATFFKAKSRAQEIPIIILSGLDDEAMAVKAVHEGAQDYLVKGRVDSQLLPRAIIYAIERTQARAALLKAEGKYRSIFENAVEGIFQTTPDGHYLSANPALTRIYGYDSPQELISNLTDISRLLYVEPGRREEFVRLMQERDIVAGLESQVYRKDGRIIWISENVRAVRDERGNLVYYEGTVEDITDRKLAQERVRNSEALYHSLVETLPQNIFRKDLMERFTFANQRFCETLAKPLNEIIGKTDYDFFPADLATKYQRDDREIMTTGKFLETVEEHQPPGGENLYVQVVKTPLYNSQGEIIGLQGIFWDITERKRAEERERRATEQLARSQDELRKKNEMMEEDLRMAHEIQQAILPQQYPTFPSTASPQESLLKFCHRYQPTGEVGGDFFNVFALSEQRAGVFICDVMGHGVRSALVTAMVRALVEELRPVASDPGQLLTRINRDLRAILQQSGTPLFTTAFYLVADLEKGKLLYANAGHPKPFLIRRSLGQADALQNADKQPRPALGLFAGSVYPTFETSFSADDLVMLFTDGLFEIESDEEVQYSQEMLLNTVRKYLSFPCSELFDHLLTEIKAFSNNHKFADDVCLLGMEISSTLQLPQ